MDLKQCGTVKSADDVTNRSFSFTVQVPDRNFFFVAMSDADRNEGVAAIGRDCVRRQTMVKASFEEVVDEIVSLNPGLKKRPGETQRELLTNDRFMQNVEVDPDNPSRVLGYLKWGFSNIKALPESIGDLTLDGGLYLGNNELTSLPASFGNLKVGGDLHLFENELTSLPASLGNLAVGGELDLRLNGLTSLPDSFGNITVGGHLDLRGNDLTSLPASFGNITVGGNLDLSRNKLTSLPANFGSKVVGKIDGVDHLEVPARQQCSLL